MYRFETNNGCSICDAMEGLYEQEPARPHAYCRCIISAVEDEEADVDDEDVDLTAPASGETGDIERTGEGWSWSRDWETYETHTDEDGDGWYETFHWQGVLSVECCDGETVTGGDYELVVSVDFRGKTQEENDELMEAALRDAESDMRKRAEELRKDDCDPCVGIA